MSSISRGRVQGEKGKNLANSQEDTMKSLEVGENKMN
jgi:hypothetical protein